jgi:hypothetical protein
LARRISTSYADVLAEPVPPQLVTAASAANDRGGRPRLAPAPWIAAAASLAVGVFVGRALLPQQGALVARDGALVARGGLDKALSAQLSAEPGAVKVGLSLKTPDGRYCRTFESAADRLAGLACREHDRWVARTVTAWTPAPQAGAASGYRQAASDTPPEVLASVDSLGGEPLDAAAERAARDRNWR